MGKISAIISKNLKIVMRSKVSSLVIIFGPLLMILLVGMAFNNKALSSINIGTYSPEYTPLADSFIDQITESRLTVIRFDSEQECADSIKSGVVNLCLVFPQGFDVAKDSSSEVANTITVYVDPSQMNLVYNVKDIISAQLENRTEELSTELTTVLLDTLDDAHSRIVSESSAFSDMAKANDVITSREASITSKLDSMDLTFNENRFGIVTLEEVSTQLSNTLVGKNGSMRTRLNDSVTLASDILSDMRADPSINNTQMEEDMTDLYSKIKYVNNDFASLDEETLQDLNQAIQGLQREVNATSKKISQMKTNRDAIVSSDLAAISSSSDTILNKMMQIKGDLDTIKTNIDSIQVRETSNIVSPIKTSIKPIVSDTYLNYMFPGLVALVVMLVSLIFAQTVVMIEKKSNAYFRNLVTPTKEGFFVFANFLTTFLLVLLQTFLILIVSTLVFKVNILQNLPSTLIGLVLIIALFTIIGVMIGMLFSSQETSTLAAVSFGSICLFLSDILLPMESMPSYIQDVAKFNPFVVGEYLLRNTIVFRTTFLDLLRMPYSDVPVPVAALLVLYILFFIILLAWLNHLVNSRHIAVKKSSKPGKSKEKKADKDKSKSKTQPGTGAEDGIDHVKDIEQLINTALEQIKVKDYEKASLIYVHLNELYALMPQNKKREYFKKIVRIHQELEKISKEEDKKRN